MLKNFAINNSIYDYVIVRSITHREVICEIIMYIYIYIQIDVPLNVSSLFIYRHDI